MTNFKNESFSKCKICGSSDVLFYSKLNDYNIVTCKKCKSKFLDPQPSEKVLEEIYSETYFLTENTSLQENNFFELKTKTAELYFTDLLKLCPSLSGKLLEIGCGKGDFLLCAKKKGMDIYGVEISSDAVSIANKRLGDSRVIQGELQTDTFSRNSFDIICLFDLIEHVRNPGDCLKKVYDYLKPGGKIFIVTPSLDSWSSKLLHQKWMEFKVEHLWYFNNQSMIHLLTNEYFSEIQISPNYKVLSLDYINRHFQRFKVPFFSPFVNFLWKIIPYKISNRPFKIVARGMMVIATK